jgi:hypothetical protein
MEELLDGGLSAKQICEKARTLQIDFRGPRYSLFITAPCPDRKWESLQLISCNWERYSPAQVDSATTAL